MLIKSVHIKTCWPYKYEEPKRVSRIVKAKTDNVLRKYNKQVVCMPLVEMTDNEFFKALSEGRV